MSRLKIADNFSRYAHLYDRYADVQMKAAFELAGSIKNDNFCKILEIGCGTGNYTLMLRNEFEGARIKALDISDRMIGVARDKLKNKDIEFIVADAENIILDEDFDLITSNACFQWFDNLDKVLGEYSKLLQKRGIICFSIFGPQTLGELNTALMCLFEEERIDSAHFCDRDSLEKILKDNFDSVKIDEIRYKETFNSLRELLEKIKYSGIRGNGLSNKVYPPSQKTIALVVNERDESAGSGDVSGCLSACRQGQAPRVFHFTRGLLMELEKIYLDRFKEICATYQVFFCQGEKR